MLRPRRPSASSAVMADGSAKCGSQSHRGRRKRGPLGAPPGVSVHARKKGGFGSPGAMDFEGAAPTTLFNANEEKRDCEEPGGS
jgi:hypothetical protein